MDISEYYNKAMKIGRATEIDFPSILNALEYESEDDRPSVWVPKVQTALIEYFKKFSGSVAADDALALYIQGEILENQNHRGLALRAAAVSLVFGLFIGWLIWA